MLRHVDSENWADALADLRVRWAHSHFVGFVVVCLGLSLLTIFKSYHDIVWL